MSVFVCLFFRQIATPNRRRKILSQYLYLSAKTIQHNDDHLSRQEEFRKFCKTTSVRGIPRIFQAKSRVVGVLWLTAFLTCFAVMSWQLSVILVRYFQHQVNTVIVQAPSWQTPTFPDVTVCNLNPLAQGEQMNQGYANFISKIE